MEIFTLKEARKKTCTYGNYNKCATSKCKLWRWSKCSVNEDCPFSRKHCVPGCQYFENKTKGFCSHGILESDPIEYKHSESYL
jgi:hypothetical protein